MSNATLRWICGSAAVLIFCVPTSALKAATSTSSEPLAWPAGDTGALATWDGDAGAAAASAAGGAEAEAGAVTADVLDAGAAAVAVPVDVAFAAAISASS